ncbi:MAG: hypothetical protein F6K35_50240 [Okeania sp. SIO2H7]|nr:hypothetical protein [Okeania sp. SIO2H7]
MQLKQKQHYCTLTNFYLAVRRNNKDTILKQLETLLPVNYLLLDDRFGNNKALQMTRQLNLHLISKCRIHHSKPSHYLS